MMEYLKLTKSSLKVFKNSQKQMWINVVNPTDQEMDKICKLLKIKKNNIDDLKQDILSLSDYEEVPLYDAKKDGVIFMIVKTPQEANPNANQDYDTIPLGVILTKDVVVTICFKKNNVVYRMKSKRFEFDTVYFCLRLMLTSTKSYLYYLKLINKKINRLETNLEVNQTNKEMGLLLDIQKSLVYFNSSIINNYILFEKIYRTSLFSKNLENKELIADILDEAKQAIQTTKIYLDNIKNTLQVLSSIISNNLNRIVKFLTSLSIIVAIPTLIASIYGMNINLPLQNNPQAFIIIFISSIVLSTFIGLFLWKRKLF